MKITSMTMVNHRKPSGNLTLYDESSTVLINFTETEAHEIFALGLAIFERRQASIAKSIADMKPLQLTSPNIAHGEFTEVDEVSF